jgi:tRNA-dependent cyclodipeptide synthase
MPAEEARIRALQLGDDFIEREKNCFAAFSDRCNFTFTRCSEAQQQARYHEMHRTLIELHQTSEAFRDSILGFAQSYHQKPRHTLQEQQWQQRMISSRDYFLEEFAILACLQEQGWPVLAYPGSFSTLDDIAEGRISGAPPPLEALMLACLHIKKR